MDEYERTLTEDHPYWVRFTNRITGEPHTYRTASILDAVAVRDQLEEEGRLLGDYVGGVSQ